MSRKTEASQDFDRAVFKAFWRKVITWIKGDNNELLPFDDVRERLSWRGQHYLGLREVPIDQIVGSSGRYLDFDRAFLPIQTKTKERWISIDIAHLDQVDLPPVELYKMGEIYFVKDGIKHPIWSVEILKAHFKERPIFPMDPEELSQYLGGDPLKFNDGELIKSDSNPTVYVVSNGQRRTILDEETFINFGYKWDNIIVTSDKAVSLHTLGPDLIIENN